MTVEKKWYDDIIPCECPKWETCKYGSFIDWKHKRYAVCGYSFLAYNARGCSMSECDKYTPKAS